MSVKESVEKRVKSKIEVPEGWEIKKLNALAKIRRGASPRPIGDKKYFSNDGRGWIRISDVTSTYKYLRKTSQYLSEIGETKSVSVDKGDLIMSICATIGKPIIVDMPACIHDGFVFFNSLKREIDTEFLFYVLQNKERDFTSRRQSGTQGNLNTTIVGNVKILKPPFNEQKKIADILSKVDEHINLTEKIIDKTEELKKGLMQKILTKGIEHTKFKKTELGEIPEEWRIKKITDCCHVNKKSISSSTNENYEISYIDIASIEYPGQNPYRKQVLLKNAPSRARRRVFDNNILVSTVRPYLRSFTFIENAEENLICSTGFGVLEAKAENHPQFIYQYILSDMFLDQVAKRLVGSNYPAINNDDLKNIKIPLPSNFNEQKQIASILSKVDGQIQDNKKELKHLQELKKGLMQNLLTGKVRVSV